MTAPEHISDPIEPSPAPDPETPGAPSDTVLDQGILAPGGPQSGETLTTSQGVRLHDSDHSLKAGRRGPTLLEDHHLREKIMHFDHERIPERVVHARGAGAHGVFTSYGNAEQWTRAGFLAEERETPVFVRFSTVVGSRGSADTVRDTRGFAVKFYTDEGTFDLVGNNIPVFFIQDGIKFPDIIHAAKPHSDVEIPQAQSAHDTFWDFVSLHTEATHHLLWVMSDRGIPRSYRTMEGFGVHTFRLVDAAGATSLVKFHWKPTAGVHSLVWEEAQIAAGVDPDFHRRDLAEAINAGRFPEWELGLQVMPDDGTDSFAGVDLLDPTKLVPEELSPVVPVGRLTLTRNPANYFAETEQVAFHVGHLVPGIEPTDDPLLHARLFSYLDTQLTRLGGPNFGQLPINRPRTEVNDNLRDGMHQTQVHTGLAPYTPNSLGGGCPFPADLASAYVETERALPDAGRVRGQAASFDDHLSQAALFFRSLTPVEQRHLMRAIAFELGKCVDEEIRVREVGVLATVDAELAEGVAQHLGLEAPDAVPVGPVDLSEALRQITDETWPVAGRVVGVILGAGAMDDLASLCDALRAEDVVVRLVAPRPGSVTLDGEAVVVDRTYDTVRSVELDAVVVAQAVALDDPRMKVLVDESYRHLKAIALVGTDAGSRIDGGPGVLTAATGDALAEPLLELLARHRAWEREDDVVGAQA
jgi:catalase